MNTVAASRRPAFRIEANSASKRSFRLIFAVTQVPQGAPSPFIAIGSART
jgi:hypothetical protein